jgi:hypothetical protein
VLRAQFVFDPVLEWVAPSLHDRLRNATVTRFQASDFVSADGEGPVTLVLRNKQNVETRLPLHPRWT